ncbi:MAG: membrane dipeptidase [Candidatus Bathyarchaeia archaeon]|jgi:membrane dipeptidase
MSKLALKLHDEAVVVDCLNACYPKEFDEEYWRSLKAGGVGAIKVTIPDVECLSVSQVVSELAGWFHRLRSLEPSKMRLVRTVQELRKAKQEGAIAVILGSQGAGFLGLDLSSLDFFQRLGMRTMQPTYQRRNQFGSGCGERNDDGLSRLGVDWVESMNKLGMVISLSHVGYKTSMEVMEISKHSVVFDHSNPKALCNHVRNIADEQIQTCAEKGGVIGLTPLSMFVSDSKRSDQLGVSDYIKHIDYVADLVGVDHVGIGLDLAERHYRTADMILEERRMLPGITSKFVEEVEDEFIKSGREKLSFGELYMPWLTSMSKMPVITDALLGAGYSEQNVKKILGANFLRVFEKVWGN